MPSAVGSNNESPPAELRTQSHGDPLRQYSVRLSPCGFTVVWVSVASLYLANGVFCSAYVLFYYISLTYKNGYYVEFLNGLPLSQLPVVIIVYALAALIFWSKLLQLVRLSIQKRTLVLTSAPVPLTHSDNSIKTHSLLRTFRFSSTTQRVHLGWSWFSRGWQFIWSGDGLLALDGPLYELLLLIREIVEVALQSYQSQKASALIVRPWINRVFVACLVLNCWISPLIYLLTEGGSWAKKRRWLFLWADVVLDVVSALVIPVLILLNVVRRLKWQKTTVEYVFNAPLDDVDLMDTILSTKQLFVMNVVDFISKLMPIYSMMRYLDNIRLLARRQQAKNSVNVQEVTTRPPKEPVRGPRRTVLSHLKSARIRPMSGFRLHVPERHERVRRHLPVLHRLSAAAHWLLLVWGLALLAFHLSAQYLSDTADPQVQLGCKAAVRPWWETKFACSVMEINCYRRKISGSANEINAVLEPVAPAALSSLIISHCPAFTMPQRIQTLHNLVGLELTNVSVVAWGQEAALSSPHHDSMHFMSLVRTNLSEIPLGLRAASFPRMLRSIQISVSDISLIPDDLHLTWRKMMNVYVEYSKLTSVPSAFARMNVERLSLLGNEITAIPDGLLPSNQFTVLSLAKNPRLQQLPHDIGSLESLQTLVFDDTSVAEIPAWLLDHTAPHIITVSLGGTPLCRSALQQTGGNIAMAEQVIIANATSRLRVNCHNRPSEEIDAYALTRNSQDRIP